MKQSSRTAEQQSSSFLLLFYCSTVLLLLFFFLIPEEVFAGAMSRGSRMMRMPKYSLWGDITLQYEDVNTGNKGTNRFTQNYRLNFQSYVISPRIMYYTITTGFDIETGTMANRGITKNYGINTVFFPYLPLNFSLRASRTDGKDYETTNYGLTIGYSRRVNKRTYNRMRDIPREFNVNKNTNANANSNANVNLNINSNSNANVNSNINANINANVNPGANIDTNANANANLNVTVPKRDMNEGPGLFSDILPRTAYLDIDRIATEQRGSKSLWDNASLRFKGNAPRTIYFLNFNYSDWKRDSTEHKGFGGDLSTRTSLKWSFFQQFDNYIYFRKNDILSYSIYSSLSGSAKKWGYGISVDYSSTSNSEKTHEFNFSINLSRSGSYLFVYKGITFNYSFGFGMERVRNKNDLWAGMNLNAHKRFGANTDLNSSLSIKGGTQLGTTVDFMTGISYTFRPRKGYTLRVELDPRRDIIKTRTFKPQVRGWDYSIRTGYTFGLSKTTGERMGFGWGAGMQGGTRTNKTLISHRADLNINVYLSILTLSSDAVFYYTDAGKSLSWSNSIYATVMRKIGVTLGTGMTVDMPKGGGRTTNYSVYNLLTYSPWRTALLRLDTRYTKTMPGDSTTLEITPSLTWRWRSVFMDFSLTFKKGGERRIMLRATRPFRIL